MKGAVGWSARVRNFGGGALLVLLWSQAAAAARPRRTPMGCTVCGMRYAGASGGLNGGLRRQSSRRGRFHRDTLLHTRHGVVDKGRAGEGWRDPRAVGALGAHQPCVFKDPGNDLTFRYPPHRYCHARRVKRADQSTRQTACLRVRPRCQPVGFSVSTAGLRRLLEGHESEIEC